MHTCTIIHMHYIHIYNYMHICIYVYVCMHTYTYIYIYIYTYTHTYTLHTCLPARPGAGGHGAGARERQGRAAPGLVTTIMLMTIIIIINIIMMMMIIIIVITVIVLFILSIMFVTIVSRSIMPRSVLVISISIIPNRGSRIPEPLLMFTSKCPLNVQISQGLSQILQIELLETGRACITCHFGSITLCFCISRRVLVDLFAHAAKVLAESLSLMFVITITDELKDSCYQSAVYQSRVCSTQHPISSTPDAYAASAMLRICSFRVCWVACQGMQTHRRCESNPADSRVNNGS